MRSPRIIVALAVVAAGAVWSGWALKPDAPEPLPALAAPANPRASAANPENVEREVQTLRVELEALRHQQGQLSKTVASVGGMATEAARKAEAASSPPAPPSPAERAAAEAEHEAERQARVAELYGQLEQAASTEPRDAVWAGRTEALIGEAVRTTGAGSRLHRAECRSSLCRIELVHEGAEARTRAVDGLLATPGLKGEFAVRNVQDGNKLISILYVAREGTRLPPFRM